MGLLINQAPLVDAVYQQPRALQGTPGTGGAGGGPRRQGERRAVGSACLPSLPAAPNVPHT
jgi:hypothetical protein